MSGIEGAPGDELAASLRQHAQLLDHIDPAQPSGAILRAVVELHGPRVPEWSPGEVQCAGCDVGAYAESDALWPCSTILTVAKALGVARELDLEFHEDRSARLRRERGEVGGESGSAGTVAPRG